MKTYTVYDPQRRHGYAPFDEVCETVQAQYGTGGGNVPIVVETITENDDERTSRKTVILRRKGWSAMR